MTTRRVRIAELGDFGAVLELVKREFSYMDGVIDPPSSVHRLTIEDLASGPGETWVIGAPPLACVVMTLKTDVLYVGKLAVATKERGNGLARMLLDHAETRARKLGVSWIELQTRIELEKNHATFAALGFVETERTAHTGYTRPTSITFRRAVTSP